MKFSWPNGETCAVLLTFEFDAESVEWGFKKTISGADDIGRFSPRFGVPRILEVLEAHDIRGTFFVPGWDAERHPETIEEIARKGHEVAAHGYTHEDLSKLGKDEEEEILGRAHRILTAITGIQPRGFRAGAYNRPLSENTLEIIRDLGYIYDSSFLDDDLPYRVSIHGQLTDLIEIPWAWPLNDIVYMSPPVSCGLGYVLPPRPPKWILSYWREEFESLYEDVGFFHLVVHPRDMGRGSRMPILDSLLSHMKHFNVWFAPCKEIAVWCSRQLQE